MNLKIDAWRYNREKEIDEIKNVIVNSPFNRYFNEIEKGEELQIKFHPWDIVLKNHTGGYDIEKIYREKNEDNYSLILTSNNFYDYKYRYGIYNGREKHFLNGIGKNKIAIVKIPPEEGLPIDWLVKHEIGHILGLDHCPNKCLMRDHGRETEDLCFSCYNRLDYLFPNKETNTLKK